MDKEIEKAIDRLSNEVCKYNINAIDYPNVIVLREDVAKLINLTKKLQQQLKKKDEVIDKAIDFIAHGDLLYLANKNNIVHKDNVEIKAIVDRLEELLQILEDKEEN